MKRDRVAKSNKWSVTFEAPGDIVAGGLSVVGDFNGWNPKEDPLKQRRDGAWAKTVRLLPGTYRFRYVSDKGEWYNDPGADGYEPSGLGGDNCLLILEVE